VQIGSHHFDSSILRAYDIRGIVGETLFEADAYYIGRSFATCLLKSADSIAVGRDGRLSSPMLETALIQGLQDAGQMVCSIGLSSTPLLYYTIFEHAHAGGIMVTGSHNPPTHNGFKLMRGRSPFFGQAICDLEAIAASGKFLSGQGKVQYFSPMETYGTRLLKDLEISPRLRVAWDTGNGTVGPILQTLITRLPCTSFHINQSVDGRFPTHPPDPSLPENLHDLRALVQRERCDIGIAFDGDGDRMGIIDENGNSVSGDKVLLLFARDILVRCPGATIIADAKTSQTFFDDVVKLGGYPIMEKTGHSIIKTRMQETGALLAGEMSGHIFFADAWYGFDDALYAALRLLMLLTQQGGTLSELLHLLPSLYATPELSFPCLDTDKKAVIKRIVQRLQQEQANFLTIDGVRVRTAQGWWLLRASNTQALLTGRAEASSPEALEMLQQELKHYLHYGMGSNDA
jgi:phosphomannomutase